MVVGAAPKSTLLLAFSLAAPYPPATSVLPAYRVCPDFETDGKWRAFITHNRTGGRLTTGITVNSGCLNPELLKGKPGARVFAGATPRDRIDG